MAGAALKTRSKKRTASKEERQAQLIQATIRSMARNGLSDTTMATVSSEAGLSQGIINLHFKSKDRLLTETLKFLADEYRSAWERTLENSGNSPAEKLFELVKIDFEPPICDRNKLAVWFAFWGESKSRPTYRKICAERDAAYRVELTQLCKDLIDQGGYVGARADLVAAGLSALTSGLWLEILTSPRRATRENALEICMEYLATHFPDHFS